MDMWLIVFMRRLSKRRYHSNIACDTAQAKPPLRTNQSKISPPRRQAFFCAELSKVIELFRQPSSHQTAAKMFDLVHGLDDYATFQEFGYR